MPGVAVKQLDRGMIRLVLAHTSWRTHRLWLEAHQHASKASRPALTLLLSHFMVVVLTPNEGHMSRNDTCQTLKLSLAQS